MAEDENTPVIEEQNLEGGDEGGKEAADLGKGDNADEGGSVPEAYADFALPEGVELDTALLTEASPMFKELGLTQAQAQKLVDFQAKQVAAQESGQVDKFTQLVDGWKKESMNDKEFGGEAFEKNVGIARQAIDKFGTPALKELLDTHGVGSHPEVVRFMWNVGKLTGEDVPGSNGGGQVKPEQTRVNLLYPNS